MIRLPGPDEMTEPTYPPNVYIRKVGETGNIGFRGKLIYVGIRYATAQVRVIEFDRLVTTSSGPSPSTPTATTNPNKEDDNEEVSHKIQVQGVTHHPGTNNLPGPERSQT